MTIVRLNGTHGSGKSTVAAKIMRYLNTVPLFSNEEQRSKRKPEGYLVSLPHGHRKKLFIVGPYETACGGCDAIQPFSDIWPRVAWAADHGYHVLFEGALVSTTYGAIGAASEAYGKNFAWAFLDTPLEVCRERVNARRAERGAAPLTDFKNVDSKWHTIARLREKLLNGDVGHARAVVASISYKTPVKDVMGLFGVTLTKEPK